MQASNILACVAGACQCVLKHPWPFCASATFNADSEHYQCISNTNATRATVQDAQAGQVHAANSTISKQY